MRGYVTERGLPAATGWPHVACLVFVLAFGGYASSALFRADKTFKTGPANSLMPKESVHDALLRLHESTGLSLISIWKNKIYEVDFRKRSRREARTFYNGNAAGWGALSNRGDRVAFTIDLTAQLPPMGRVCRELQCLGIASVDGTSLHKYSEVGGGFACWSHDDTKLALLGRNTTTRQFGIYTLTLDSETSDQITSDSDYDTFPTSQCWSPDDSEIVYTVNRPLGVQLTRIYNVERRQTRELGRGGRGTWSPDGRGVAVLNCPPSLRNCPYELVDPVTGKRAKLFTTPAGQTPVWWSPDSRFVAYVSPISPTDQRSNASPAQVYRLRVRRLADNAEDWVLNLTEMDALEFQWTTKEPAPTSSTAQ